MSDDIAREFLQHLARDEELQRRILSEVTDPAEAVAVTTRLANEAGFDVGVQALAQALEELAAASGGEELDDGTLEQVAGGASGLRTAYKVVINHEEQYSIWPADRESPFGWKDVGKGLGPRRR